MLINMKKYLFIIDNTVLLVICFDPWKLHHEVHEVRAAFFTLQEHEDDF